MSLASIIGGVIAFPVNYWLVKNHLKHGCMTLPAADVPAPGLGHQSPEQAESAGDQAMGTMEGMKGMEDMKQHESMPHNTAALTQKHGMEMHALSLSTMLLWITGTYLLLFAAILLTARWVPISFS